MLGIILTTKDRMRIVGAITTKTIIISTKTQIKTVCRIILITTTETEISRIHTRQTEAITIPTQQADRKGIAGN